MGYMVNTSIKTKRAAKKSSVAHSTRCKMISKSWMSPRTKSHNAPRIAIHPERQQETMPDIAFYRHKSTGQARGSRFITQQYANGHSHFLKDYKVLIDQVEGVLPCFLYMY